MPTIISSDIAQQLVPVARTIFFGAYNNVQDTILEEIATVVPSDSSYEKYTWLGSIARMREWKDERVPEGLKEYDYLIKNRRWEMTIGVDVETLQDEKFGQVKARLQDMGQEARRHKDVLAIYTLLNGFTQLCYDGQYYFDTDHQEGKSPTQSNKTTYKLSFDNIWNARLNMMQYRDDKGKIMGIVPDTLLVGPQLEKQADQLLNNQYLTNLNGTGTHVGSSGIFTGDMNNPMNKNQLLGKFKLRVTPLITDASWYLADMSRPLKPLIFQNRFGPHFSAIGAGSETEFWKNEYYYGVWARYNCGYGLWQCCFGSTGVADGTIAAVTPTAYDPIGSLV